MEIRISLGRGLHCDLHKSSIDKQPQFEYELTSNVDRSIAKVGTSGSKEVGDEAIV